jgi:hypothetical protein
MLSSTSWTSESPLGIWAPALLQMFCGFGFVGWACAMDGFTGGDSVGICSCASGLAVTAFFSACLAAGLGDADESLYLFFGFWLEKRHEVEATLWGDYFG